MRKVVALTLALLLVIGLVGGEARDATGTIQSVDSAERVIVLDDGTTLWIAEEVSMESLREGARVRASYEERGGKNVVTLVEVED